MPRRIFITVAERSADGHAANLVRAMRSLDPTLEFHALGGDALRAAGATVHHDTVAKAAMGLAAFKRAGEVKRLLAWTRDFYAATKPDLHICCDSWTMNVHFARLAKSFGVPVLYYISPQVWASREGRTAELGKVADAVACILPFEEQFLRDRGVNATFVGHPLFDELSGSLARSASGPLFPVRGGESRGEGERARPARATLEAINTNPLTPALSPEYGRERGGEGVVARGPTVALPCGSRAGVARANFPRQLEVARRIRTAIPDATFLVPTTPATHQVVTRSIVGTPFVAAEVDHFDDVIRRCDLAITVSGTATLHIAALGVPMIVVYYGNPLLWHAIGRWMIKIRTYAMVNLLANNGRDEPGKHIVPEHIPWNGPVDAVADQAIELLRDPAKLAAQRAAIRKAVEKINTPGASLNTAKLAMDLLAPVPSPHLVPSPGTPGEG